VVEAHQQVVDRADGDRVLVADAARGTLFGRLDGWREIILVFFREDRLKYLQRLRVDKADIFAR
jgi:hypothetical protein